MSSCTRKALCSISRPAAAGNASSARPPSARAVAMHSAGRKPLPDRSMKSFTSPYRCRCGSHVGMPAASVSASMSRYQPRRSRNPAGPTISPVPGTVSAMLSSASDSVASRDVTVGSTMRNAPTSSMAPSLRSSTSATGLHERRNLLEQRAHLLEERRRTADGVGRHLHERIVPRQAGLVSRGVVQPPWREDLGLVQRPYVTAGSIELHGVKQPVHRAPRRLVGALHRREVGISAHVVGRQKQVRNGGGRLGAQRPGVDQVHQQRLRIPQEARACGIALDVRVEEPRMQVFVAQQFPVDVDRALELIPCLAHHLFTRALHGGASVRSGAVQSETSTERMPRTSLSPNSSGGTLRQNWSCEMLVSAHSVSM